jgi:threonine dehydrogenase-like Zn-dependent dehydrogenase
MNRRTVSSQNEAAERQLAAAVHAVRLSEPRPSDSAAVVGDGGLALATVAALLARGLGKVCLVTDAREIAARAASAGATVLRRAGSAGTVEQIRASLGGYGADFVFACESGSQPVRLAIEIARPAGMIVLLGEHPDATSMNPNLLVFADKRVQGSGPANAEDVEIARDLISRRRCGIELQLDR